MTDMQCVFTSEVKRFGIALGSSTAFWPVPSRPEVVRQGFLSGKLLSRTRFDTHEQVSRTISSVIDAALA